MPSILTRRSVLRTLGVSAAGLLAAACAPATPAPAPTIAASTAAPKPAESPVSKPATGASAAASPAASVPSPATKPATSPSPAAGAGASASPAAGASPVASTGLIDRVQPLPQRATVKMMFAPQGPMLLPFWLADARGYFTRAGIDAQLTGDRGSQQVQLTTLGRGDIDLLHTAPAPGLFNQFSQGFDTKVVASVSINKEDRLSGIWFSVTPDKKDQIKTLADLKGTTIEAGQQGTPSELLAKEAIKAAGLKEGQDVTLTYRVRQPTDFIALAQQKAADVYVTFEPFATQMQAQNLAIKWKTYGFGDLAPWYQPSILVASQQSLSSKRPALEKFLEVYLVACREINATNGRWTDEFVQLTAKNIGLPPEVITAQGGVPYFDPNGTEPAESLEKTQQAWVDLGSVQKPVDIKQLLDSAPIDAAAQRLGRA